jgi:putative membrane protein insertion efficiency factor
MWRKVLIFPFLTLIKAYQWILSPLLGANCRFQPTCSHYAFQSLKTHGVLKGLYLSIIRISKCHPWGDSGYDPVPEAKKQQD